MIKLSDLELITAIAEIEGIEYENHNQGYIFRTDIDVGSTAYNPLTDKALLLDLILKHKVCIDRGFAGVNQGLVEIWPKEIATCDLIGTYSSEFNSEEEFPRAALECIVGANNG